MDSRWAIFREKNFLTYWLGVLLSAIGDSIFSITLSWMIVELTGSGLMMGTYLLAMGIPRSILMLVGGVYVDRLDPRKVMIASDLLRAGVMAALLAVLFTTDGAPPMGFLFALAVIFGAVDAFYWPAASVVRQRIVEKERFTQSNSILTGTMQGSSIIGPMIGAALLALGGYKLGTVLNGVSFVLSAVSLLFLTLRPAATGTQTKEKLPFRQDLLTGVRYVLKTPVILTMLLVVFFANAGANGVGVGMAFLASEFGVGAAGLSHMSAGFGIGGVLGAVILSLIVIKNPTPRMTLTAFFVQGIAIFLICLTGNQWQVAALTMVVGLSSTAIQVIAPSVNQSIIPPELMGRVYSVSSLLSMGSTPVAQALAGWLLDGSGAHAVYFAGGLLEIAAAGIGLFVPAIRLYGKKGQPASHSENFPV